MRLERSAWLLLALCACGRPPEPGPVPASDARPAAAAVPRLVPRIPELTRVAAKAAAPADESVDVELRDLVEVAFGSDSQDPAIAKRAERSLLRHEGANRALEAGLGHLDAAVRGACAWQLGERGVAAAIPEILWRIRNETDPLTRVWMADALAKLGNDSALPTLALAMGDSGTADDAGQSAIRILTEAGRPPGDEPTWDALRGGLTELHDAWVRTGRRLNADAGGPVSFDKDLEARVAQCLIDLTDFQLRPVDRARTVLKNLGAGVVPWLELGVTAEEPYLRMHVLEVARDVGRPAQPLGPSILPLLNDPLTKTAAAVALGAVGHAPALAPLVEALRSGDAELSVAAADGLGRLGDRAAIGPLRDCMLDVTRTLDQRVFAAGALARLGEEDGVRFLDDRLAARDYHEPTVRELRDASSQAPR
jgi:HEAT repeat protein